MVLLDVRLRRVREEPDLLQGGVVVILPGPSMDTRHSDPLDPATRVVDALGREWAVKTNGTWAALGDDVRADNFTQLAAKYGPCEVLG